MHIITWQVLNYFCIAVTRTHLKNKTQFQCFCGELFLVKHVMHLNLCALVFWCLHLHTVESHAFHFICKCSKGCSSPVPLPHALVMPLWTCQPASYLVLGVLAICFSDLLMSPQKSSARTTLSGNKYSLRQTSNVCWHPGKLGLTSLKLYLEVIPRLAVGQKLVREVSALERCE